jgi:hypothetical protein
MIILRVAVATALSLCALAQTEPVELGGTGTSGGVGRNGLDFKLMGDGPEAALPSGWGTLRTGYRMSQGGPLTFVSHYVYDSPHDVYFGYDVLIDKQPSGAYTLTFAKLSLSPLELVYEIRRNPPVGWPMPPPSRNPADWTFEPLPAYLQPQTLREGETLRVELLTDKDTGRKMYENLRILPERGPVRASIVRGAPLAVNRPMPVVPTVAGTAREFSAADAELQLTQPHVTLNGAPQDSTGRNPATVHGPLLWFYLPGHGRYVLSLVPHPDLDFKLAGEARGGVISFSLGAASIKLECPVPVAPGSFAYNLYVLHDPEWEPTAQAQKGQFALGSVDPGELIALRRK